MARRNATQHCERAGRRTRKPPEVAPKFLKQPMGLRRAHCHARSEQREKPQYVRARRRRKSTSATLQCWRCGQYFDNCKLCARVCVCSRARARGEPQFACARMQSGDACSSIGARDDDKVHKVVACTVRTADDSPPAAERARTRACTRFKQRRQPEPN